MQKFLDSLKGYRTVIINGILALVSVLVAFGVLSAADAAGITQETVANQFDLILGGAGALIGAVNILLRLVTNTPVGSKAPKSGGAG